MLIVDDDLDLCESIALLLQDAGKDARACSTIDSAVEEARARWTDLILCDWSMPSGGAAELARRLDQEAIRYGSLMVMTGLSPEDLPPEFRHRILPKPFGLSQLLKLVQGLQEDTARH